ncbi:hypothetical protein [Clostridium sp.]|uniref:hypothetical protein n=1 Tax=Clostridium sp. TaxID=1506 RepID=UPI0028512B5C|nr:hypothetical protein [Clostridium sp.]MDR3594151.1 hypothetical protein [Clostridium sp.]
MVKMSDFEIKRNKDGNLVGMTECTICKKMFQFEENKNSEAVVKDLSDEFGKTYVRLDMFSKCPNCGYRIKHFQTEENNLL